MKRLLKISITVLALIFVMSALASCAFFENLEDKGSKEHTISFDFGDSDLPEGFEESVKVTDGGKVVLPTPEKEGYNFIGWYAGDKLITEDDTFTADTTISAKWEIKKFEATFVTLPNEPANIAVVNWGSTIAANTPEREGYNFLGWYVGEIPFTSETKVTENITVTAKWEIKKVTVTFQNFFGETVKVETVDYGTTATAPEVDAEAQGKPFLGWSSDITCVKEDITVKPIYDHPSYIITFNVGSATAIADQKVYIGEKPVKPEDPYKAGYTLAGWYLEATHENEYKFDTALDANTTLYAKFNLDYIMISTAEELNNIRNDTTAKYLLVNDIDLKNSEWTPIENFSGIIDGNGHKIYNFTLSGTVQTFGFINRNNGTLQNINFSDFNYIYYRSQDANAYSGVIVGQNYGTVKNCVLLSGDIEFVIPKTDDCHIGGLVGYNRSTGTVSCCTNNVEILVTNSGSNGMIILGSAVGENSGLIEKTVVHGKINFSSAVSYFHVGGIVGINYTSNAKVSECTSYIQIDLDYKRADESTVGLIVGRCNSDSSITDCVALGTLNIIKNGSSGVLYCGGVVGRIMTECLIKNIYADVNITIDNEVGGRIGGLVGLTDAGSVINNSVYIGKMELGTGVTAYGFIVGELNGATRGCYYDTANVLTIGEEVKTEGTCTEGTSIELATLQSEEFIYNTLYWDSEIWQINEGTNPTLKCFAK